ncbi:MAG: TIM barrel protein [Verrucomicrobiota bacterium]
MTRRHLITSTLAASLGTLAAQNTPSKKIIPIGPFTKPLQFLSFEELAETLAELGFQGAEVPIRPGGHIEPEAVPDQLPALVEAFKKHNLEILAFASGINQVSAEQHTETILTTAAKLGIKRYRLSYYRYDLTKPILPQLDDIRPRLHDLAALNKQLGIQGLYQNHSGRNYVGGPLWDICQLLAPHNPKHLGLAFDIGHATVEGGMSWPIQWKLAQPHLGMIFVKDYLWKNKRRQAVPLGTGQIAPAFFKKLPPVPISLHVEYHPIKNTPPAQLRETFLPAFKNDLQTLQNLLSQ